jgi:ribosomal protein S18 acetylase RimI-like enzyme
MTADGEPAPPAPADLRLRRPVEADQARIVRVIDEWFGGRRVRHLVARAWFRHFAGTSWIAEGGRGEPIGFLTGYVSPEHPDEAVLHLLGVDPNHRRRGIGRALVASFLADATAHGSTKTTALAWPDEPIAIAFFRALGFRPYDGPGSQNLFGTPAIPDHESEGEDRVMFEWEDRSGDRRSR